MSRDSRPRVRPSLLDSLIIVFVSAALVLFLFWMATASLGLHLFDKLPDWVRTAFGSIYTSFFTGAAGLAAAVIRTFQNAKSPRPNYLLWIIVLMIVWVLLVFAITKMVASAG